MRPHADRSCRLGFTLLELVVSLLIGVILIAGGLAVLLGSSRLLHDDTMVSEIQGEARVALDSLAEDVRRTGIGGMGPQLARSSGLVTYPAVYSWHRPAQTNGFASDVLQLVVAAPEQRLSLQQAVTAASDAASFGCGPRAATFTSTEFLLLTDLHQAVIQGGVDATCATDAILRGTTIPVPLTATSAGALASLDPSAVAMPVRLLRFDVEPSSDGTPYLAQTSMSLNLGQAGHTLLLTRGIESLTVAYGQDTNNDGVADVWTTDPPGGPPPLGLDQAIPDADPPSAAVTALADVVALRLTVTARSTFPVNQASGTITQADEGASGGYIRRSLTMDVPIRNGRDY